MKTIVLIIVFVSACITRTVTAPPVAPTASAAKVDPSPEYHHAKDLLLGSKSGVGAKCDIEVSTAVFDSAKCELASGAQLYCWHAQPGGMGCFPLYAPPPQAQPQPAPQVAPPSSPPPAKVEAPKKK